MYLFYGKGGGNMLACIVEIAHDQEGVNTYMCLLFLVVPPGGQGQQLQIERLASQTPKLRTPEKYIKSNLYHYAVATTDYFQRGVRV